MTTPRLYPLLALVLAASACHKSTPPGPLTPEQVLTTAPGTAVTVQGTVFTTTYDDAVMSGKMSTSVPAGDRWVLIRTFRPPNVTLQGLDPDAGMVAWGLGLHLTAAQVVDPAFSLPAFGDVVLAKGTFVQGPWNGTTRPMVDPVTSLSVVNGRAPLAATGASCATDMDCRDELICDRSTLTCQTTPSPVVWSSPWHDVNGACSADADCPVGQTCDLGYAIPDAGSYSATYFPQQDIGRHLCVPKAGATQAQLCPRADRYPDLVGGRYIQGKEVCIQGSVNLSVLASDGDTHNQLIVTEPLPYPATIPVFYDIFGATSENSPPYKDPARPGGALPDFPAHQNVVVLGTYRFDDGHGWFEVHPIKAWWPAPP